METFSVMFYYSCCSVHEALDTVKANTVCVWNFFYSVITRYVVFPPKLFMLSSSATKKLTKMVINKKHQHTIMGPWD